MDDHHRLRIALRRLTFVLPLLALPFAPVLGKLGAEFVISIAATQDSQR
jgi:hypothetical protein